MPKSPRGKPFVTPEQVRQYHEEGYMVLERVIPDEMLALLREECSYFLGYKDAQMDAAARRPEDLSHRGRRYFINNLYRLSPRLWQFIYGPLMAEVAQSVLGPDVWLFHEQWVIKGAEKGTKFSWHQDSGYVARSEPGVKRRPYLTCWCPLDDVNEENGTVYVLPHARGGTRDTIVPHVKDEASSDLVGYHGDDPGIPVIVPAGSIVAFTSFTLHRSGPNTTPRMRRVYLPQYSAEPILRADGTLWALGVPFVKQGRVIYQRDGDTAEKYGPVPRKSSVSSTPTKTP